VSTNPPALQYGVTYHIYNRGIDHAPIFHGPDNYRRFLQLYAYHVGWLVDTYAYCLLSNHFHFALRVKDRVVVEKFIRRHEAMKPIDRTGPNPSQPPSQHFSNLFNAYARAFNKRYGRDGALFKRPFGRIPVTTDAYFAYLIVYIHQNPQKHGFVADYREWPYSSYQALAGNMPTQLDRAGALE